MPWRKKRAENTGKKEIDRKSINDRINGYIPELIEEMNLRMILLQEDMEKILFVECILVDSISYPKEKKIWEKLFSSVSHAVMKSITKLKKERRKLLWQLQNSLRDYKWIS